MALLTEADTIRDLRKHVVRADRAYVCCKSNVARTFGDVTALLTAILASVDASAAGQRVLLAFLPSTGVTKLPLAQRLFVIAEGELTVGLIVILGVTEVSKLAATKAVYDALSTIGTAIGTLLGQNGDLCEECVKGFLLSQSNPRVREFGKHRARLPGGG